MELTSEQFEQKMKSGEKMVVEFWAPWCGPCKMMKPTFEKVSQNLRNENFGVTLYTMNVDSNRDTAMKYGIRSIPTTKAFSNGKESSTKVGVLGESQIKEFANSILNG
jgi:thioredoxin 1